MEHRFVQLVDNLVDVVAMLTVLAVRIRLMMTLKGTFCYNLGVWCVLNIVAVDIQSKSNQLQI